MSEYLTRGVYVAAVLLVEGEEVLICLHFESPFASLRVEDDSLKNTAIFWLNAMAFKAGVYAGLWPITRYFCGIRARHFSGIIRQANLMHCAIRRPTSLKMNGH